MVLIKRIHNRGANIVVEANGEVLFAPTGDVGQWTSRFSRAATRFSAEYAPTNKRPRWSHYGKPLKTTFTSSTVFQPGRMKVHSAVGSTSPHAYYVDQGTGVFAGNGPYKAKILPPWHRGSASLYEHTWRPGGPGERRVKPVMIRGQRAANEGKGFFDPGLTRAFQYMRMRSFQVPADGKITAALGSFPEGLANFAGNTEASPGFVAQLEVWRTWRDEAWRRREELGKDHRRGRTRKQVRKQRAAQSAREQAEIDAARKKREAYEFSIKASNSRKRRQEELIAAEKKRRQKAAERRAREAAEFRLKNALRQAEARGKLLANTRKGFNVEIHNAYRDGVHTGYFLEYTDKGGLEHSELFE